MEKINESPQKNEGSEGSPSTLGAKATKIIVTFLVVVLLIMSLQFLAFFGMLNWLYAQVRTLTGLDMFLVKGISFLLLALVFGTPFMSLVWSFLPIPQKHKKRKRFMLLSVLAIFFFAAYFASKNVYFNSANGAPMKYYSIGPNGEYNFYSAEGYDPVTGDKLRQVDKGIVTQYLKKAPELDLNKSPAPKNIGYNYAGESILTGAEKDSRFYSVKFINKTKRNIYFCISFRNSRGEPIIIQKMSVGESCDLKLMEGGHYFSYMDNNGYCYGEREDGNLLSKTNGQLPVIVNNQQYYMNRVFYLDVIASNEDIVTLEEDLVSHNNDLTQREKALPVSIIIITIGISLFLFWGYMDIKSS